MSEQRLTHQPSRSDFLFASAWDVPLHLPLIESFTSCLPVSDRFTSQFLFEDLPGEVLDIENPDRLILRVMNLMASIAQAITAYPSKGGDRVRISNSIYVVEFLVLSPRYPLSDTPPTDISEPLRLSMILFIHLGIRELPPRATRNQLLIKKLFNALPHDRELSNLRASSAQLSLLLWIFFVGAAASDGYSNHFDFQDGVLRLCDTLQLWRYEDFESRLEEIAWVPGFCAPHATALWKKICGSLALD